MTPARVGPYLLLRELGRGGMGVVHVARDERLGREVALKLIKGVDLPDAREEERFLLEARAMGRLVHRNVVRLLDAGRADGHLYIATELIAGRSLEALVRAQGPLDPRLAARLGRELAEALQAAHLAGILHRDLKPGNVLLGADGVPKLLDFGLARLAQDERRLTRTGEIVGTPAFMAPEQAMSERELQGPATDVYGLGATLYQLVTGRPPFGGSSPIAVIKSVLEDAPRPPSALRRGLDRELERVILCCLEKDPARRYGSMAELGEELARCAAPRSQRGRRIGAALGVVIALGAAANVGLALRAGSAREGGVASTSTTSATPPRASHTPPRAEEPVASTSTSASTSLAPEEEERVTGPTLSLDADALGDPARFPGLEVGWPLGLERTPSGAIGLRASGQTQPELRLPLRHPGGAFRLAVTLEVDLLEPTNVLSLALVPRGEGEETSGARIRVSLGDRRRSLAAEPAPHFLEARVGPPPGQEAQTGRASLAGLRPGEPLRVEVVYQGRPGPRVTLRVERGSSLCLLETAPLDAPLRAGDGWLLRIGANPTQLEAAQTERRGGNPTCAVRARLRGLELQGLVPDAAPDTPAGRLARAARALHLDPQARDRARAELEALTSEAPLEAGWLRFLLEEQPAARARLLEGLWDLPGFDRRWRLELFALPPPWREALVEAWRRRLFPERDEKWLARWARWRVWGKKGGLTTPPEGVSELKGGEDFAFADQWVRAHEYFTDALVAFQAAGGAPHPGSEGFAAVWTGELERGLTLLRAEAEQGNKDAFMHTQWAIAAFRLGDEATGRLAWIKATLDPRRGPQDGLWQRIGRALLEQAAARQR